MARGFLMNDKEKLALGVVGILGLIAAVYMWRDSEDPKYQTDASVAVDFGGMFSVIHPKGVGEHFCPPDVIGGPTVFTRHRYPNRAGHEITAMITGGFAPLIRRKPRDVEWMMEPPSEATL